ncbi:MAG: tRNA (adenosine(37)-N6)-threonylcarbamoyltransferase complex transferase subunit TsaD [Acutalibacteraceae bacterium]|nr:tRNA (adenosine(37)-N6)-threonylcarbamoyltransferase complex transferase subunit TsaD [Acutalibacteraceae bacterium]
MKILAIESSCDDTAVAILEERKVLSSVIASQVDEHIVYGGVVPEIASRMHIEAISNLYKEALKRAELCIDDIDAIAVTYAPGLIGSLLVGVNFAKGLSLATGKPLIPVHHLRSHIAANYITYPELKPPFLALVISGGHSHIINVKDYTDYEIIGRTRDDAAGECFDKTARALGLPYPGGVHLDKIAENGNNTVYKLPKPKIEGNPLDFSFSGLKTAVLNTINNSNQKGIEINTADMCASIRKTVTDILIDKLSVAFETVKPQKLVLAGGVSANSEIRKRVSAFCKNNNVEFYSPELSLCGDNAAMVGAQAYYEYQAGNVAESDLNAYATLDICTLK